MPKIFYVQHNGTTRCLEGEVGQNVMQLARDNMLLGIVGECGGACSCATCHGYVDPSWTDKVPPKSPEEAEMLDGLLRVDERSRLTCQIKITPELDGLVVKLPESQF